MLLGDRNAKLRCAVTAFDVKRGLRTASVLVVDTSDTNITRGLPHRHGARHIARAQSLRPPQAASGLPADVAARKSGRMAGRSDRNAAPKQSFGNPQFPRFTHAT
jgi:hypothetical protein